MIVRRALIIIFLAVPACLVADAPLNDPGIPDGETAVYILTIDDNRSEMTEKVAIREKDGRRVYELTSVSVIEDRTALQECGTMIIRSMDRVQKSSDAHVHRVVTLAKTVTPLKKDEAGLIDFRGLQYLLRAFPFGRAETMKIVMYGNSNAFPMVAEVTDRETISVGGREYACYKITLGVAGLLGRFLPKSHFWYLDAAPHTLIRYEGSVSGPGSPDMVVELKNYSR